jgi:oligopeptidase A
MTTPATTNPLLTMGSNLPPFDQFTPVCIAEAVGVLIASAQKSVEHATADSTSATWDSLVLPIEESTEKLSRAWGMVGHLNGVADSKELRDAYNAELPKVTQFWTSISQNLKLFDKYKALKASPEWNTLNAAQRKAIDNAIRGFKLGGAELQGAARERYAAIADRAAELQQKFSENVLDATNAFELIVTDESQLQGIPADALAAAKQSAKANGKTDSDKAGWRFTLQFPSYFPIMQYGENRALRETLYKANVVRASELSASLGATDKPELNNGPVIQEIMGLRQEEAELLGYKNFAEVSLVPKMAQSPEQVETFLLDLASKAKAQAKKDLEEVKQFGAEKLGITELQAWDVPFVSEKLKAERYSFSDTQVKEFFTVDRVLAGLFGQIEKLFDVKLTTDTAATWHPDVRFYKIERAGQTIGQFYLDLYSRESKRPGAWMDDARARKVKANVKQTPVAYLTCNFQAPFTPEGLPETTKVSLLSHDDVITLFHEFGHGLHHMLTQVNEIAVSGISGVEWDAVELPSQFMENFCWDWNIVKNMTAHVKTGEPMGKELFDKMTAAKNFQSGMQTLRQVEFSLFDMRLHRDWKTIAASSDNPTKTTLEKVRSEVAVVTPPAFNRFQNSFSHIFGGGYAAGYYSYKWAEVLSADCYAAFEEAGADKEQEIGKKFLREILEVGGSRPAIDSFRAFRGRDPQIDALLRHNGIAVATFLRPNAIGLFSRHGKNFHF